MADTITLTATLVIPSNGEIGSLDLEHSFLEELKALTPRLVLQKGHYDEEGDWVEGEEVVVEGDWDFVSVEE